MVATQMGCLTPRLSCRSPATGRPGSPAMPVKCAGPLGAAGYLDCTSVAIFVRRLQPWLPALHDGVAAVLPSSYYAEPVYTLIQVSIPSAHPRLPLSADDRCRKRWPCSMYDMVVLTSKVLVVRAEPRAVQVRSLTRSDTTGGLCDIHGVC